jgi:hypothetical protein
VVSLPILYLIDSAKHLSQGSFALANIAAKACMKMPTTAAVVVLALAWLGYSHSCFEGHFGAF